MKSKLARFLLLCVVGFGLGAALAWMQNNKAIIPTGAVTEQAAGESPAVVSSIVPNAPEMPQAAAPEMPVPGSAAENTGLGGAFSLTDQNGVAVTEKSWPGKYKLVFFGFTHCPDICPATLQKLSTVIEQHDPAGDTLQVVFITTDPARDTSQVIAGYLKPFNAHITGLTGTEEQVRAAEDSYKVYASVPPEAHMDMEHGGHGNYMVDHSSYVYLVSPDNHVQDVLRSDLTAEEIVARLKERTETGMVTPAPESAPALQKSPAENTPVPEAAAPVSEPPVPVPSPAAEMPKAPMPPAGEAKTP